MSKKDKTFQEWWNEVIDFCKECKCARVFVHDENDQPYNLWGALFCNLRMSTMSSKIYKMDLTDVNLFLRDDGEIWAVATYVEDVPMVHFKRWPLGKEPLEERSKEGAWMAKESIFAQNTRLNKEHDVRKSCYEHSIKSNK